jgi:biopolymer transport protein ExbD
LTDEVMGPDDQTWQAIEDHPQLAEVVADIEPPPPSTHEDETRLDMNAMIDVTLVLLIFFILLMTYGALDRLLESPRLSGSKRPVLTKEDIHDTMIRVEVRQNAGQMVINMSAGDDVQQNVPLDGLARALDKIRGTGEERKKRTALLVESDYNVKHGVIVAIQDAAKEVGISKVIFPTPGR